MKIVCDSCGAKYSIADEKVAGKVFKIRCKKCSAVIVVKGDQEESDEATRVYDYGSEAVWHVVVGGDQQGPVTPRQLGEMLAAGTIDWEAYVWREGMDGWQAAKDVEPLVNAIMAESEGASAPQAGRASEGQMFAGSSDMGADPFAGGDDGGLSGVLGQAAGASAAGGGADLFAQASHSPFAGSTADDLPNGHSSSHSSPRVSETEAMTGQRNENSVLFSLSNLQALATGSSSASPSTRPKPGMAQGEGSGLIDIRALASATQAVAERPTNGSSRDKVEDLLAVGAAGTGFSAATLAAPVVAEKADSNKLVLGGMAAAILLLGAAVGYLALRQPEVPQVAVAGQLAADGQPQALAAAAAPGAAPAAPTAAAAPTPEADEAPSPAPSKASARAAADDDDRDSKSERKSRRSGESSSSSKSEKSESASSAAAAPATPPPAPKQSSTDKSIDDLLSGALGGKPAAKPAASKPAENMPATPSRDDVLSAMKGVTPKVQACSKGESGIAMSKVGVAGPTGRVTSVEVSGQFAGTPVAACIVKEVSKAKFPKFSQATFSFSYPFKI